MTLIKKILIAIAIVFIGIQFLQPDRNKDGKVLGTDISKIVTVSDSVHTILKNACYDCHSNNTGYPWYSNIQPAGWLLAKHIKKGKNELNFSDFGSYSSRRQTSKLEGISNILEEDEMPLLSYKLMHKNARLSLNEKRILINWAQKSNEMISQ